MGRGGGWGCVFGSVVCFIIAGIYTPTVIQALKVSTHIPTNARACPRSPVVVADGTPIHTTHNACVRSPVVVADGAFVAAQGLRLAL